MRMKNKEGRETNKPCYPIIIPKRITSSDFSNFLYSVEFIFGEKLDQPLIIEFQRNFYSSYLALLVIYMILKITTENQLAPLYIFHCSEKIKADLIKNGFLGLYDAYLRYKKDSIDSALEKLEEKQTANNEVFILPQPLGNALDVNEEKVLEKFLSKIRKFYIDNNNSNALDIISTSITEIVSNFWAHANCPDDTIIFARGNNKIFYLCILDIGVGVISNLLPILNTNEKSCLLQCINRGISSKLPDKNSYHMGRGLYYIRKIVENNNGELNIWSEGFHLTLKNSSKSVNECGYWRGCILELKLSVKNAKKLSDCI